MLAVIKALFLPPGGLIVLGLAGLWLCWRRIRLGGSLVAAALSLLYVFSTPLFSTSALSWLSPPYVDPRTHAGAQAIVILAGGTMDPAPEYGADTVNHMTLVRVRYAARLYALTGKPILVSGGSLTAKLSAEARQMQALLVDEFHVPVRWVEDRSRDTYGNAVESYRILAPLGVKSIYLVTHAWHMPRARLAFEHAGFDVIAAPTEFHRLRDVGILDFLPCASALQNSYYFFHEVVGYLWYTLRVRT